MILKSKWIKVALIATTALVFVSVFSLFISSAEDIVVKSVTDTNLTFHKVFDPDTDRGGYDPVGSYSEPEPGLYEMTTNAFTQWYDSDSLHFAYEKFDFVYGKLGTLTAETTLTSWEGITNTNAGAGLMMRTGLGAGAATFQLHCRSGMIFVTYRSSEKTLAVMGQRLDVKPNYPVTFKAVLNNNKVSCFFKQSGDKDWTKLGTVMMAVASDQIYVGLSAYSQDKASHATAKFNGFSASLTVPEGTDIENPSDPSSGGEEEEEEIKLPEDLPPAPDVLMRETFTDGLLDNTPASITNPIWKTNKLVTPQILLNPEKNNRFLYNWMDEDAFFFAGNQHWTDYSVTAEITFTDEFAIDENNVFSLFARHTDILQYGVHDYGAILSTDATGKRSLRLIGRTGLADYPMISSTGDSSGIVNTLVSVPLDYLSTPNEMHRLKIDVFDNIITVYWDGVQMIKYTDNSNFIKPQGSVGFLCHNAAVKVDNITVIKLNDLLGGDYDNRIGGNWNQPIPELVQDFENNEWSN